MDLSLTDEQRLIAATMRDFVERELYPHEDEVERLDEVPDEVARAVRKKAIAAGLYAPNMPAELGAGWTRFRLCWWNGSLAGPATRCRCWSSGPATSSRHAGGNSGSAICCRRSGANGTTASR